MKYKYIPDEAATIVRVMRGEGIQYIGLGSGNYYTMSEDDEGEDEMPESRPEIIARLAKQGGYILLVGGGLSEMGELYNTHPQIIIWDDLKMNGLDRKVVPSNTRAILCSKWMSHKVTDRLQDAATRIHSIMFPMLSKREIREMLAEMLHSDAVVAPVERETDMREGVVIQMNEGSPTMEQSAGNGILMGDDVMRAPKRGELDTILSKELGKYNVRANEIRRLIPILAKQYGIKATIGSLGQAILAYERRNEGGIKKPATHTTIPVGDDFAEAERILKDAKAAIDLMLDFIPKLRKEVAVHRGRTAKLRQLLGDD